MIIMETVQHTNFLFHLVEVLASSPIWLGACGFGIIVLPIMGIAFIHNIEENNLKKMMDPLAVSAETGIDYEITSLISEIEEKYGIDTHMVIEPIYGEDSDDPKWWCEFEQELKIFDTIEEVKDFFINRKFDAKTITVTLNDEHKQIDWKIGRAHV